MDRERHPLHSNGGNRIPPGTWTFRGRRLCGSVRRNESNRRRARGPRRSPSPRSPGRRRASSEEKGDLAEPVRRTGRPTAEGVIAGVEAVGRIIERLELGAYAERRAATLSQGNAQRLG